MRVRTLSVCVWQLLLHCFVCNVLLFVVLCLCDWQMEKVAVG